MSLPGITLTLFDGLEENGQFLNVRPSQLSVICQKTSFTHGHVHSGLTGLYMFTIIPSTDIDGYEIVENVPN